MHPSRDVLCNGSSTLGGTRHTGVFVGESHHLCRSIGRSVVTGFISSKFGSRRIRIGRSGGGKPANFDTLGCIRPASIAPKCDAISSTSVIMLHCTRMLLVVTRTRGRTRKTAAATLGTVGRMEAHSKRPTVRTNVSRSGLHRHVQGR